MMCLLYACKFSWRMTRFVLREKLKKGISSRVGSDRNKKVCMWYRSRACFKKRDLGYSSCGTNLEQNRICILRFRDKNQLIQGLAYLIWTLKLDEFLKDACPIFFFGQFLSSGSLQTCNFMVIRSTNNCELDRKSVLSNIDRCRCLAWKADA